MRKQFCTSFFYKTRKMLDPISDIQFLTDITTHKSKKYGSRKTSLIDKIIVHSSGTLNGTAASFARYHVENLDWPGIGYHVVTDRKGIFQTQNFSTISYHCSGLNVESVGVCKQADYDRQQCTDYDYLDYVIMCLFVMRKLGRELPVYAHYEFTDRKTCPGRSFDIDRLRDAIDSMKQVWL